MFGTPPLCNEQGKIPTTEQHLDVVGSSTSSDCNYQWLLFTIKESSLMVSIHNNVYINIPADMWSLSGSNNTSWRKKCFQAGLESHTETETDSGAKIPFGFFALSLTMMLLHVRAEECCLQQFDVSFQVKMILLCIKILPNAFKKKKKKKKKTLMPIEVDCRLVDAWLILLAPWSCPSANLPCQLRSASIGIGCVYVCLFVRVFVCLCVCVFG